MKQIAFPLLGAVAPMSYGKTRTVVLGFIMASVKTTLFGPSTMMRRVSRYHSLILSTLMMTFLALSSVSYRGADVESVNRPRSGFLLADSWSLRDHSPWSRYSLVRSTDSLTLSAVEASTFCDPSIQYSRQPAECQTAASMDRLTHYTVIVGALLLGLLATLLAFVLIRL